MSRPPERSCKLPTLMGSAAKAGPAKALAPAKAAAVPRNCLRSIFISVLPFRCPDTRHVKPLGVLRATWSATGAPADSHGIFHDVLACLGHTGCLLLLGRSADLTS